MNSKSRCGECSFGVQVFEMNKPVENELCRIFVEGKPYRPMLLLRERAPIH